MTSIEVFLITMLRMGELELQDAGQLDNVGNFLWADNLPSIYFWIIIIVVVVSLIMTSIRIQEMRTTTI